MCWVTLARAVHMPATRLAAEASSGRAVPAESQAQAVDWVVRLTKPQLRHSRCHLVAAFHRFPRCGRMRVGINTVLDTSKIEGARRVRRGGSSASRAQPPIHLTRLCPACPVRPPVCSVA